MRRLGAVCLVVAGLLACAPGTDTSSGGRSAAASDAGDEGRGPTPTPTSFRDDFEDPRSGWLDDEGDDGAEAFYADGAYEMAVGSSKSALSRAPDRIAATSVAVSVSAKRVEDNTGEFGGGWGLICEDADDEEHYYQAFVQVSHGRGRPGLFRWEGGEVEAYRKLREHDAVKPDGVNRLELQCSAERGRVTVVFVINGVEVARGAHDEGPDIEEWETALALDGSPLPRGDQLRMRFDDYEVAPLP